MSDDPTASAADTHDPGGEDLPGDLVAYRESYTAMFGTLPPLPAAKFAFTGQIAPDFLRRVEELRARAFTTEVFDPATTQLLIFAMMLATSGGAADWHATAARRAGASWEQLQTVVELASAVAALGPANVGGAVLQRLHSNETPKNADDS